MASKERGGLSKREFAAKGKAVVKPAAKVSSKDRGGLSSREFKAAQSGGTLDYKTGNISAPKPVAKKVTYNMNQGSATIRPVSGPPAPASFSKLNAVANYTPANKNFSSINDGQRKTVEQPKSNIFTKIKSAVSGGGVKVGVKDVARELPGAAKKVGTTIKDFFLPGRGFTDKQIAEAKPTLKEGVVGGAKTVGEIANIIPKVGGLLAKGAAKVAEKAGAKEYAEKVRKGVDAYNEKSDAKLAPKTAGEAKVMRGGDVATAFIGGTGKGISAGGQKALNAALKAGRSKEEIQAIVRADAKGAFSSAGSGVKNAGKSFSEATGVPRAKAAEFTPETKNASFVDDVPRGTKGDGLPEQKKQVERVDVEAAKESVKKSKEKIEAAIDAYRKAPKDELGNISDDIVKSLDDTLKGERTTLSKAYKDVTGEDLPDDMEADEVLAKLEEFGIKNERQFQLQDSARMSSGEKFDQRNLSKGTRKEGRDLGGKKRQGVLTLARRRKLGQKKDGGYVGDNTSDTGVNRSGTGVNNSGTGVNESGTGVNISGTDAKKIKQDTDNYKKSVLATLSQRAAAIQKEIRIENGKEKLDLDKIAKLQAELDEDIPAMHRDIRAGKLSDEDLYNIGEQMRVKGHDPFKVQSMGEKTGILRVAQAGKKAPAEAYGVAAGVEQDEDGNFSLDPTTAALGILGIKAAKTGQGVLTQARANKMADVTLNKERGLITSAKAAGTVNDEIKKMVDGTYTHRNSAELMQNAKNLVKDFPTVAADLVRSSKDTDVTRAVTMEMIKKYSDAGMNDEAIDLIEKLAPKATEAGRATQILAYFNRLTPEGVGRFAQRQVNIANEMFPGQNIKMTEKQYTEFYNKAKELQKLPDGYEKDFQTAILLRDIKEMIPSSVASKIGTFQTIGQLLNPKTFVRNFGGNVLFGMGLENITQAAVRTPVDALLGLFTGKRTVTFPSAVTQFKGFKKGLLQGIREARAGVAIGPNTQFDLPQTRVFRSKVMSALETAMGVSLRGPDKAAFTAAFDDSIRGQMKANKVNVATPEMLETAHYEGLYRTFQDDNLVSKFFVGMKKVLNTIGIPGAEGARFGLGDLVLKYPKTPGSLIGRGIDYSPAGFVKTLFEAGKPLFGKPFDQKKFVDSFSRALVGSGALVGMGATLEKLGIITGAPEKDFDTRATQRTTGQTQYQINASGLKRFIMSGFNKDAAKKQEGDTLVNYDWAQPMAAPISLGAKLSRGESTGIPVTIAESIVGGVDTLQEQSLVTGLKRLFGYGDIKGGLEETFKGAPASFVPTASNQFRQFMDNTRRSTYDPNMAKEAFNRAIVKIPGLSGKLPASADVFGKEGENYQEGSNSFFNVFLNPAFVNTMRETPEAKMVLDLYESTGETSQMPKVTGKTIKINGEDKVLDAKEYVKLQKFSGEKTREAFLALAQSEAFKSSTDEQKVKQLSNILTDIGKLAKVELFGDKEVKAAEGVEGIVRKVEMRDIYRQVTKLEEEGEYEKSDELIESMSEEDQALFKTVAASEKRAATAEMKEKLTPKVSPIVDQILKLEDEGKYDESDALFYGLSEDEQKVAKSLIKNK